MNIDETIQIALEYINSGNLKLAEKALVEILEIHPDNATALSVLGIVYYYLNNYDSAILYSKKALHSNPTNAYIYYNLGNAFREKNNLKKRYLVTKKLYSTIPTLLNPI